jgi:hypothetical protein
MRCFLSGGVLTRDGHGRSFCLEVCRAVDGSSSRNHREQFLIHPGDHEAGTDTKQHDTQLLD